MYSCDKSKLTKLFVFISIIFAFVFWVCVVLDCGYFSLDDVIFIHFTDYLADFVNHAKLFYQNSVYSGELHTMTERALLPLEYILMSIPAQISNYNSVPTNLFDHFSINSEMAKCIYFTNYFLIITFVSFFIFLYEKIKLQNKYIKAGIISVFLLSAPIMFELERANIIILAVLAVSYFLFNYNSDNKYKKEFALISIAFASALKYFPVFFLLLLISNKDFKSILKVVLYSTLFFICPMLLIDGGLANIPLMFNNTMLNYQQYDYSLWMAVPYLLTYLLTYYKKIFLCQWQNAFLVVAIILTINNFNGYRMLYLFPIFVLFINKKEFHSIDYIYVVLFILLLSPLRIISTGILIGSITCLLLIECIINLRKTS